MSTETPPLYISISKLSEVTGLPAAFLKRLTDDGRLPYLEPLPHKRHYCLADVQAALARIAHENMRPVNEAPIDFKDFNLRTAKVLRILKIDSWEKLAALPEDRFLSSPGVGKGSWNEIRSKLQQHQAQPGLFTEKTEGSK